MGLFRLFTESWFIGLSTLLLGLIITSLWIQLAKLGLGKDAFNDYYPYYNELSSRQFLVYIGIYSTLLFLIGISVHLVGEMTQINKWYCKNGNSCK